jgi:LPXTG-motif cell wall-anchored protein
MFNNAAGSYEAFTQSSTGGVWGTAFLASFASGVQNATPSASLNSVSCWSAGNCTAAGQFWNAAGGYGAFSQTATSPVAPTTTVVPTTTVTPSTTVVPMTTVAPSSLPATGSDGRVNVLIGMSLLLCGFGLMVWRRRSI